MPPKRPARRVLRSLCADLHPDDGIDPRESIRAERSRPASDHRARRLCRQVAETLGAALAGQCNDDILRNLLVVSVEPAPDVSRLIVTVRVHPPSADLDPAPILARLAAVSGRLRAEVAGAITRRKVPALAYRLALPAGESTA